MGPDHPMSPNLHWKPEGGILFDVPGMQKLFCYMAPGSFPKWKGRKMLILGYAIGGPRWRASNVAGTIYWLISAHTRLVFKYFKK